MPSEQQATTSKPTLDQIKSKLDAARIDLLAVLQDDAADPQVWGIGAQLAGLCTQLDHAIAARVRQQ